MDSTKEQELTREMVEKVSQANVDMTMRLGALVEAAIAAYREEFPDNPVVPYTVIIGTLAKGIGQLVTIFEDETQEKLVSFAFREIVDNQHRINWAKNPSASQLIDFGNA